MILCNLPVLLAERKLKVVDVWRATGISRTTLHGLYNNTHTGIQFDTLDKLCSFLNVEPSNILTYCDVSLSFSTIHRDYPDIYTSKIILKRTNKSFQFTIECLATIDKSEEVPQIDASIVVSEKFDSFLDELPTLFSEEIKSKITDEFIDCILETEKLDPERTYTLSSVDVGTIEDE